MKKYLFLLLAASALVACGEDEPTREPSPVTPENCQNVYFSYFNDVTLSVLPSDTEIALLVERAEAGEAVEVPVKVSTVAADCFEFPKTISFAEGETMAEYVIGLTEAMELFQPYDIVFEIAPEYADYYTENDEGSAHWNLSVMKSDFQPYAEVIFASELFTRPWYQEMAYSAILDRYRLTDIWDDGLHFDFTWDGGDTFYPIGPESDGAIQVYIGPYDATHDMYFFCPIACPYDAETQTFTLNPDWYVTGYGSQGMYETEFQIVELY